MRFVYKIELLTESGMFAFAENGIELDTLIKTMLNKGIPIDRLKVSLELRETTHTRPLPY